jgi:hypothetical protein
VEGLDYLVRLSDLCADDADRIFERNPRDRSPKECPDEIEGFGLLGSLLLEPASTRHCQVGTRWMGYY